MAHSGVGATAGVVEMGSKEEQVGGVEGSPSAKTLQKPSAQESNGRLQADDADDRSLRELSTSDLYDLIELAVESKLSNLNLLPDHKDNDHSEDDAVAAKSPLEKAQARARAQHLQEIHLDSNGRPESPLSQASEPHDHRRTMPFGERFLLICRFTRF